MDELEEKIFEYLKKYNKKISYGKLKNEIKFKKLKRQLNIHNEENDDLLLLCLKRLEVKGKILFDEKNDAITIFKHNNSDYQGKFYLNKNGCGLIKVGDEKFIVRPNQTCGALDGDIVLFAKEKCLEGNKYSANIKKVIQRKNNEITCLLLNGQLIPYGINIPYKIAVNERILSKYQNLDVLIIQIENNLNENKEITANVIDKITNKAEPNYEEKIIATMAGFPLSFSSQALKEADDISENIDEAEIEKRLDLRDDMIFTIDCDSTKDMDDAVSIKKLNNGHYILGVHIAHVDHYIKPNTALWHEAYARGTSLYMVNSVLPMLPPRLSDNICSLNPNKDRLTLSTIMEFDQNGNIVNYEVKPSVINSKAKLKYSTVNELLENDNNIENFSDELVQNLKIMEELSNKIEIQKEKRGYLKFANTEIEVVYDENNEPIKFINRENRTAQKLIENFMVSANTCIGENYIWMPFLYRIHDLPNLDKLASVFGLINKQFMPIKYNDYSNKAIQQVLNEIAKTTDFDTISRLILPCMARAEFSTCNIGHFGLALDYYSQSTSPIRRFNDLMIQHLIGMSENINKNNYDKILANLNDVAKHCSQREQAADAAERIADNVEMAKYMEKHIGEEFTAKITNITTAGLNIITDNNILGYVPVNGVKDDYYNFDEYNKILIGNKHHNHIKIGDFVTVKAVESSVSVGLISFELENILDKKDIISKKRKLKK